MSQTTSSGTITNATISSGDTLTVTSGSVISGASVSGTLDATLAESDTGVVVYAGGSATVGNNTITSNLTVSSGATLNVTKVVAQTVPGAAGSPDDPTNGISDSNIQAGATVTAENVSLLRNTINGTVSDSFGTVGVNTIGSGADVTASANSFVVQNTVEEGGKLTATDSGTVLVNNTASSGGSLIAVNSATAENNTVSNGGSLLASGSGTTSTDNTILAGGTLTITDSANTQDDTVYGTANIAGASVIDGMTVESGGILNGDNKDFITNATVNSGATVTIASVISTSVPAPTNDNGNAAGFNSSTINSGSVVSATNAAFISNTIDGTVTATSGTVVMNTVGEGGSLSLSNTTFLIRNTVQNGGSITIADAKSVSSNNTVGSGGVLTVTNSASEEDSTISAGGMINVTSGAKANGTTLESGATLTLDSTASISNLSVSSGSIIDYTNNNNGAGTATAVFDAEADTLTITDPDGTETIVSLDATYENEGVTLEYDGNKLIVTFDNAQPCFLAGTMILTPNGEVPVETLSVGDTVITINSAGEQATQTISWIGTRFEKPAAHETDRHPICIAADSFGPGHPSRDLYITPEHCVFARGCLIPVRMLANNRSIFHASDLAKTGFTIYHVETEEHSILLSNNLATESYLDTGGRSKFRSTGNGNVEKMPTRPKVWNVDSAARLATERDFVEPIWNDLKNRAVENGISEKQAPVETTTDPDLKLCYPNARNGVIRHMKKDGDTYQFMIPKGHTDFFISSRASAPSETIGPFVDDRRDLGVLVSKITHIQGNKTTEINSHLSEKAKGWYPAEAHYRWTQGYAQITVPDCNPNRHFSILEITIPSAGPYVVEQPAEKQKIAS